MHVKAGITPKLLRRCNVFSDSVQSLFLLVNQNWKYKSHTTWLRTDPVTYNLIKLNFHQFYFLRLKDTLRSNVCCTRWVQRGKTGSYGGGLEAGAGQGRVLFPGWGVLTDRTGEEDIWIFLFLMRQLEQMRLRPTWHFLASQLLLVSCKS